MRRQGWQQDFAGRGALAAVLQRTLALEPPDYFETRAADRRMMTVPQLKRYIDELSASGFNVARCRSTCRRSSPSRSSPS